LRQKPSCPAIISDDFHGLGAATLINIGENNFGTGFCKRNSTVTTDTRCRTGYEGNFARTII
jgi:hypothetical protein